MPEILEPQGELGACDPLAGERDPGCSLEGLMLKLKLQYFGHLMGRVDSLEKTLMLGGIGGRPRVPVASQEESLSTGKARGTPGSCHHSLSPPDISVYSRETCFPLSLLKTNCSNDFIAL